MITNQTQRDASFDDKARELLREMTTENDSFENESRILALDVDEKLAIADKTLEEVTTELEKGDADATENTGARE